MLARVVFDDITCEKVAVTPLGDNQYRLDCYPSVFPVPGTENEPYEYDDIFEATTEADGSLRVNRLVHKSDGQNYCWITGNEIFELQAFIDFIDALREVSGYWESMMGIVCVWVPHGAAFDADEVWRRAHEKNGKTLAAPGPSAAGPGLRAEQFPSTSRKGSIKNEHRFSARAQQRMSISELFGASGAGR